MLSYAGKKRINIIWMCRDPGLIEYFLHKVDINAVTKNSFALIFYTGKRELVLPNHLPINLLIFRSRPKLEETIARKFERDGSLTNQTLGRHMHGLPNKQEIRFHRHTEILRIST